jgi:hypothetical protein
MNNILIGVKCTEAIPTDVSWFIYGTGKHIIDVSTQTYTKTRNII